MLTKSQRYFYDAEAAKVPSVTGGASKTSSGKKRASVSRKSDADGENGRNVQTINSEKERRDIDGCSFNNNPSQRITDGKRLRRSSDWFFETWQGMLQDEAGDPLAFIVNTRPYRAAHFATFPPDLVRPMILSSTSAKGACPECGAPRKRILEKTSQIDESAKGSYFDKGKTRERTGGDRTQPGERYITQSVGWEPSCDHVHENSVPCAVLDPFGGSGTTAQVALELGHKAILIELNPEYIPLIQQRCAAALQPTESQ